MPNQKRKALNSRFKSAVDARNPEAIARCAKEMADRGDFDINRRFPKGQGPNGRPFRYQGYTPLILLARYGYEDGVEALLKDPSLQLDKVRDGYHALLSAAAKGQDGIVNLLLSDKRCDAAMINARTLKGHSAIVKAAQQGHANIVDALKEHPFLALTELKNAQAAASASGNTLIAESLDSKIAQKEAIEAVANYQLSTDKFPHQHANYLELGVQAQTQPSAPVSHVNTGHGFFDSTKNPATPTPPAQIPSADKLLARAPKVPTADLLRLSDFDKPIQPLRS